MDPVRGVARNDVARAGRGAVNHVPRRVDDEHAVAVGNRGRACERGADEVALHRVVIGGNFDADTGVPANYIPRSGAVPPIVLLEA